jgi:hypothetical protein
LFSEVIGFSVGPTLPDLKALHGNNMQMDDRKFFYLVLQHTDAFEKRIFDFLDIKHVAPLLTHCPHT